MENRNEYLKITSMNQEELLFYIKAGGNVNFLVKHY